MLYRCKIHSKFERERKKERKFIRNLKCQFQSKRAFCFRKIFQTASYYNRWSVATNRYSYLVVIFVNPSPNWRHPNYDARKTSSWHHLLQRLVTSSLFLLPVSSAGSRLLPPPTVCPSKQLAAFLLGTTPQQAPEQRPIAQHGMG